MGVSFLAQVGNMGGKSSKLGGDSSLYVLAFLFLHSLFILLFFLSIIYLCCRKAGHFLKAAPWFPLQLAQSF